MNTFAAFDRKLTKNLIKRCAIEPLEVLTKQLNLIAADEKLSKTIVEVTCELCNPKYCTEALAERLAHISGKIVDQIPSESMES